MVKYLPPNLIPDIYDKVINKYELFFMTPNGYEVFNSSIMQMTDEQIVNLKNCIKDTFPINAMNKELSFAMQNLVRHICFPLRI